MKRDSRRIGSTRRGISRLDLLVAVAVMALIFSLFAPAMLSARMLSQREQCANKLKDIGRAFHRFEQLQGGLPPRRVFGPYRGWAPPLLPHLGEKSLAAKYQMDKDFFDPANREAVGTRLPIFECPAAPPARRMAITDLASNETGVEGALGDYFGFNSVRDPSLPARLQDNKNTAMIDETIRPLTEIVDGTSWTLLLSEQAGRPEHWVRGEKQKDDSGLAVATFWGPWPSFNVFQAVSYSADGLSKVGPCAINCNNSQGVYAFHPEGANGLFVDGSVRLLGKNMAPEVLFGLVTRNGGEVIGEEDLK